MYVIRKDGIAVKLTEIECATRYEAIDFAHKNQYLAVLHEGRFAFTVANPFTKQLGRIRVLESVPDKAKLFTETDALIKDVPFYFRGFFGISSKKQPYTRLHVTEFTVLSGNAFQIYVRDDVILFLITYSPDHLTLHDIKNDVISLGKEVHGFGKRVEFVLAPNSTGYF